jgi:DNA primase
MSKIKDKLENEIYPALYENIETALPEFDFTRITNGYQSTSEIKITGEEGKPGKVYIYDNNISHLIDYTRGSISIWDYLQQRDSLSNLETLQLLAELSGVALKDYTPEELEKIKRSNREAQIWEDANNFLVSNFHTNKEPGAEKVREYCKARGYTVPDVKTFNKNKQGEAVLPEPDFSQDSYKMELGYLKSQLELKDHLISKGYTEEEIEIISLLPAIGDTHRLTIPYRDPAGRIRGIAARNINYTDADKIGKYLYSTGLKRGEFLFNLRPIRGEKDLIIVEGLLDCLIATARGQENIVALGGTSLNSSQIKQAVKHGAIKITLCFDRDEAGYKATKKVIQTLLKENYNKIFIAELPVIGGKKSDPDSYIIEKGIDSFNEIITTAKAYYHFFADELIKVLRDNYPVEDKYKDSFEERIAQTYIIIPNIIDRDKFLKCFNEYIDELRQNGIYKSVIEQKIEELSDLKNIEAQKRQLNNTLLTAQGKLKAGNLKEAQKILEDGVKNLRIESGKDLIKPYTYESWVQEIHDTPPNLVTGITGIDDMARIPLAAITLIASRPSHGKTTLMLNLLLNMCNHYLGKKFYYFSYEEQKKFILLKILNILIGENLFFELQEYPALTNLERLKCYIQAGRNDNEIIEKGKRTLKFLIDNNRLEIIDAPYTVEELSCVVAFLHSTENLGAIFIDYIQRVRIKAKTQDKRVEIATISQLILNNIAKETGLPVILGAQLNRSVVDNPALEGLKEAGNLEEDANLVLSVYNKSREEEPTVGGSWGRNVDLLIKTLKNRDGEPNQECHLDFNRFTGVIADYPTGTDYLKGMGKDYRS